MRAGDHVDDRHADHTGQYAGFIAMLGVTIIAAPGVPGGAIMAALGPLQSMLGFDETLQGLMIALYIAMDSFGTGRQRHRGRRDRADRRPHLPRRKTPDAEPAGRTDSGA